MAVTIANECRKAALDGITGLLTGGDIRFDSAANAELAVLPLSWAAASTASPSTAVGTATADAMWEQLKAAAPQAAEAAKNLLGK